MNSEQQSVANWMTKFGQEVPTKPTIPSFEIRRLRAKLILEEALETVLALGVDISIEGCDYLADLLTKLNRDNIHFYEDNGCVLSEVMDGVADSLVVQLGTAVAVGLDVESFFREVMRSNDSKLWTPEEIQSMPVSASIECVQCGCTRCACELEPEELIERRWLVKDRDGKVIKSPSYSPADCEAIVIQQAESCNH